MNFKDMYYLQTLVRCQSYSKAAQELIISQPALSQTIRQLEKEYQITIFTRKNRKLVLTESGEILLHSADRILNLKDQIQEHFKKVSQLTPPTTLIFSSHMEFFFEFMKQQPLFELPIHAYFVYKNWRDSSLWDLKLSIEKKNSGSDNVFLCKESLGFLMTDQHPLSHHKSLSIEEAKDYPLLLPPPIIFYRETIQKIFSAHNFEPKIAMESDNYSSYPDFLSGRDWIALIPEVSTGLQQVPNLKFLPWNDYPADQGYSIFLSVNPQKRLSPQAELIKENLITYFKRGS